MNKHTPGPWLIREPDNGIYDTDDDIANVVARGPYGLITIAEEVDVADARLIAAAPELLEVLRDTLAETIESRDSLHAGSVLPDGSYGEDADEIDRLDRIIARARAAIAKATGQENL